jgi:AraC-like DNA-binding protein
MDKFFHIFEIDEELVNNLFSRPFEGPHFHDYDEIIILTQGSMKHYIDFNEEEVIAPFACYISTGKMHRILPQKDFRGWVVNYKIEFIPDSKLNIYSNFFTSTNASLSTGHCLNRLVSLCEIINAEYHHEFSDYHTIRYLLNGLISMIYTERKRNVPVAGNIRDAQYNTFHNFLKLVEEYYRRDEGVEFYAGKLNMSARNLNIICKNNFQKSVSEIIETRKLVEAKHMLIHTDKTVSEIGFELGYNEKSYFTRVFHNKMDITPSRFREMVRSLLS